MTPMSSSSTTSQRHHHRRLHHRHHHHRHRHHHHHCHPTLTNLQALPSLPLCPPLRVHRRTLALPLPSTRRTLPSTQRTLHSTSKPPTRRKVTRFSQVIDPLVTPHPYILPLALEESDAILAGDGWSIVHLSSIHHLFISCP